MRKFLLTYILLSLACASLYAQQHSFQKDPFALSEGMREKYNQSFLIQEDTIYKFMIADVFRRKEGRILLVRTEIDSSEVYAFVIVPYGEKIKMRKGEESYLSLRRYFFLPELSAYYKYSIGDNDLPVTNVLVGNEMWKFSPFGTFSYLFLLSPDEESVKKSSGYSRNLSDFQSSIRSFVTYMSYSDSRESVPDCLDTLSILKHYRQFGCRTPQLKMNQPYTIKDLLASPKLVYNARQNSYHQMFKYVQEQYSQHLPAVYEESNSLEKLYESIHVKLLYCSSLGIYTIQLSWIIPETLNQYVIIIDMRWVRGKVQIISINEPYGEYNRLNNDSKLRKEVLPYIGVSLNTLE